VVLIILWAINKDISSIEGTYQFPALYASIKIPSVSGWYIEAL
jgi:hypothetical protein